MSERRKGILHRWNIWWRSYTNSFKMAFTDAPLMTTERNFNNTSLKLTNIIPWTKSLTNGTSPQYLHYPALLPQDNSHNYTIQLKQNGKPCSVVFQIPPRMTGKGKGKGNGNGNVNVSMRGHIL
jgi:hypothetical protein